ncbi:MAG: hypothetical protein CMF41_01690 [Legionellales bacterium]|nr:hypothetical protein [Legionellales bacterium]OUX66038.1 MAG: hypothetical protein CBE41_00900 [Gammaproteobacteria bacterium TMED281]
MKWRPIFRGANRVAIKHHPQRLRPGHAPGFFCPGFRQHIAAHAVDGPLPDVSPGVCPTIARVIAWRDGVYAGRYAVLIHPGHPRTPKIKP